MKKTAHSWHKTTLTVQLQNFNDKHISVDKSCVISYNVNIIKLSTGGFLCQMQSQTKR
nr:MAG TPA: hypothetical protein [Caudoviricetes sp.]